MFEQSGFIIVISEFVFFFGSSHFIVFNEVSHAGLNMVLVDVNKIIGLMLIGVIDKFV